SKARQQTHLKQKNPEHPKYPAALQPMRVRKHSSVVEARSQQPNQADRDEGLGHGQRKTFQLRGGRRLWRNRAEFALERGNRHVLVTESYADITVLQA